MDILQYIKGQETYYNTTKVPVVDGWDWNMAQHVKLTTLYLNSRYENDYDGDRPYRQIILPKVNLEHRAMRIKGKDIEVYINDSDNYYKSLLVRKFHDKWALEQNIINEISLVTDTYTDYGGVLLKKLKDKWVVVPFQRLAFCDQTDMLSGPICEKHQYTPDQLLDMKDKGWGNTSNGATNTIEALIAASKNEKTSTQVGVSGEQQIATPGKYIPIYEIHGTLEESYLYDEGDPDKFVGQMLIVAVNKDQDGKDQASILFRKEEKEFPYDAIIRDPIFGRALGRGAVEELFEAQVWVNYSEIQKKELLDEASKVLYQTTDPTFTTRNNTTNVENGHVFTLTNGASITPVNNTAPNVAAFENAIERWDATAKDIASAYDTVSGADSKSGMPFRLGMLLNQEGHSLHQDRKDLVGNKLTQIYKNWTISMLREDILDEQEFFSSLSMDEIQAIADKVATNLFNRDMVQKVVFSGQMIAPGEQEQLLETYKSNFLKGGLKRFFKLLKNELKDLELDVIFSFTDALKDHAFITEKLSSVWSQVVQILQVNPNFFADHPEMAKLFNEIIESSGLSAVAFGLDKRTQVQNPQTQAQQQMPMQGMMTNNQLSQPEAQPA